MITIQALYFRIFTILFFLFPFLFESFESPSTRNFTLDARSSRNLSQAIRPLWITLDDQIMG